MNSPAEPATILILDDDEIQRDSIEIALHGTGRFIPHGDPRIALEFLQHSPVDVIILDIRMPSLPVDGLWFLSEFRKFDPDTEVIIRTGDDHITIAEAALDARATQRVIKSHPEATARLRAAVHTAIQRTRQHRNLVSAARSAATAQTQLMQTLARIDEDITVAALARAMVSDLLNHSTALNGYVEFLNEQLRQHPQLADAAKAAHDQAGRVAEIITEFLSNPYTDTRFASSSPSVNPTLTTLNHFFAQHRLFLDRQIRFTSRGTLPDLYFSATPARLLTALRHLVEYCAQNAPPSSAVVLSVDPCPNAAKAIRAHADGLTINARWAQNRPAARFAVETDLAFDLDTLRHDLHHMREDPRTANLLMLTAEILDEHLAFSAFPTSAGRTVFHLYVPLIQ